MSPIPAGVREAFKRLQNLGKTLQDQMEATDGGVMSRDLAGLLHAGDRRWTFPTASEIGAAGPTS